MAKSAKKGGKKHGKKTAKNQRGGVCKMTPGRKMVCHDNPTIRFVPAQRPAHMPVRNIVNQQYGSGFFDDIGKGLSKGFKEVGKIGEKGFNETRKGLSTAFRNDAFTKGRKIAGLASPALKTNPYTLPLGIGIDAVNLYGELGGYDNRGKGINRSVKV